MKTCVRETRDLQRDVVKLREQSNWRRLGSSRRSRRETEPITQEKITKEKINLEKINQEKINQETEYIKIPAEAVH